MYQTKAAYIELSSACNLKCKHCYNNSGNSGINLIDQTSLIRVIDELAKLDCEKIALSGGEPLAYKNIIEIIKYISKSTNMRVSIVTNATLITEDFINQVSQIINCKRLSFQVSLDGITSVQHEYLRGSGTFEPMMRGVSILEKYAFLYYFHVVIHKHNYKDLQSIVEYAISKKHTSIDFTFIQNKGRANSKSESLIFDHETHCGILQELNQLEEAYKDTININIPSLSYGSCPLVESNSTESIKLSIRIDYLGNIYPCQIFTCENFILGNIYKDDMSTSINRMRSFSIKVKNLKSKKCDKCFFKAFCHGGCPGIELEDIEHDTYNCELRKFNFDTAIRKIVEAKNQRG